MGIYAVVEEFWVAGYHFEVSFRSVNAGGLYQKDEVEP
jgi:hypothetical protein